MRQGEEGRMTAGKRMLKEGVSQFGGERNEVGGDEGKTEEWGGRGGGGDEGI